MTMGKEAYYNILSTSAVFEIFHNTKEKEKKKKKADKARNLIQSLQLWLTGLTS